METYFGRRRVYKFIAVSVPVILGISFFNACGIGLEPTDVFSESGVQIAPDTYQYGPIEDENGDLVIGTKFVDPIHESDDFVVSAPKGRGGGSTDDSTSSDCFSHRNRPWRKSVPWTVTSGPMPLDRDLVISLLQESVDTWNSNSSKKVFGNFSEYAESWFKFGDLGDGVGAVTMVYQRYHAGKYIPYKWVMTFNSRYAWSTDGSRDALDFLNVATHEFGHAAGMGHPDSICREESMYSGTSYGETKKRDLHSGDISGFLDLY